MIRYFIGDEPGLVREKGAKFRISGHMHMPHEAVVGKTASIGNRAVYHSEVRGAARPDRTIEAEAV